MPDLGSDAPALAPVVRLHPIRTLVIARDLAFRQRAITVVAQLGAASFAIAALDAPDQILALVAEERADVIVLDATGCGRSVAALVHELCERAPRVGVVLVSSNPADRRIGLPVLPKWGWASDLVRAVQIAYRDGNPLKQDRTQHA